MNKVIHFVKKYYLEIIICISALLFSTWLYFSTFFYSEGSLLIASKAWSDFASHIPLIISFSFGDNFPIEYPLFSGPFIKYHFLFYAIVGLLEKFGIRIDFALNIPSIIGFTLLILMIYLFSKEIFKSKVVGILSILFFIFNGSLSFIDYFKNNTLSLNSFSTIFENTKFTSFGPYDGGVISAFWNLNIYTNQRHLAISYALALFIIYIFLRFKETQIHKNFEKTLFLGILLGLSFMLNMAVFLMTVVILFCLILFLKNKRVYIFLTLLIAGIIALPQYLFLQQQESTFNIALRTGYLVENLNIFSFINYWVKNLGLHVVLIPLGFILASKISKKILLSFISLFIIANLLQFSPEIAANHKFINFFMIVASMFSAYFLFYLWNKRQIFKPFVIVLILFLTLSGIIDFFPILNDSRISLSDYPVSKNVSWIIKNTKKDSVFLNNQYLYNDASLAGRKIFLGWPYFAWSQGYNTQKRDDIRKSLLNTKDLEYFCKESLKYRLNYVDIDVDSDNALVNIDFFDKYFKKVYENKNDKFIIYDINSKC